MGCPGASCLHALQSICTHRMGFFNKTKPKSSASRYNSMTISMIVSLQARMRSSVTVAQMLTACGPHSKQACVAVVLKRAMQSLACAIGLSVDLAWLWLQASTKGAYFRLKVEISLGQLTVSLHMPYDCMQSCAARPSFQHLAAHFCTYCDLRLELDTYLHFCMTSSKEPCILFTVSCIARQGY